MLNRKAIASITWIIKIYLTTVELSADFALISYSSALDYIYWFEG